MNKTNYKQLAGIGASVNTTELFVSNAHDSSNK